MFRDIRDDLHDDDLRGGDDDRDVIHDHGDHSYRIVLKRQIAMIVDRVAIVITAAKVVIVKTAANIAKLIVDAEPSSLRANS